MNAGRGWAYVGAVLGGVVSIAANIAHSYVPPTPAKGMPPIPENWSPEPGAVIGAVFWPVALFVAIEILARVAWPNQRRWVALRFLGLLPVALVAAIVSYRHLSGLLAFYGEDSLTVAIGPLAVDGLMLMATGALIATSGRGKGTSNISTPGQGADTLPVVAETVQERDTLLNAPVPERAVLRSISIRAADEFPVRSRRTPGRSLERPGLHRDFDRDFTETSTESGPGVRPVPATPDTASTRPLALIDPATMAPFAWPIDDDHQPTGSTPGPLPLDREWSESRPGVVPLDRESDREWTGSATEKARLYWENERAKGRTPTGADLDFVAGTRDYGRKLRSKWLAEEQATGTGTGSDPDHSRSTGTPTGSTPAAPRVDRESTESRPGVVPVPLSTNGHHNG